MGKDRTYHLLKMTVISYGLNPHLRADCVFKHLKQIIPSGRSCNCAQIKQEVGNAEVWISQSVFGSPQHRCSKPVRTKKHRVCAYIIQHSRPEASTHHRPHGASVNEGSVHTQTQVTIRPASMFA